MILIELKGNRELTFSNKVYLNKRSNLITKFRNEITNIREVWENDRNYWF